MAKVLTPVGFWSYARQDDTNSDGQLSQLRAVVGSAINLRWGDEVRLFQDSAAIPFGADWAATINSAIGQTTFFIPVVTPRFLKSENCRDEFTAFRRRMAALGRSDLIFPIHYVDIEQISAAETVFGDELTRLRTQQWIDFRSLKFSDPKSSSVRQWADMLAASVLRARAEPTAIVQAPQAAAPVARAPPPQPVQPPSAFAAALRRGARRIFSRLGRSVETDIGAATAKFVISAALFACLVLVVYKFNWDDIRNWAMSYDANAIALRWFAGLLLLSSLVRFKTLMGCVTFLLVFWVCYRYAPLFLGFTPWAYIFRAEDWMVFITEDQWVQHFPQSYSDTARWDYVNSRDYLYWFATPVLMGRVLFSVLRG